MLKPERLKGLGLSVTNKLIRSLSFRQAQLETCKRIIYDSHPKAQQTPSVPDVILTSFYFYIAL